MNVQFDGQVIGEIEPTSEGIWYRSSLNTSKWGFAPTREEARHCLITIMHRNQAA